MAILLVVDYRIILLNFSASFVVGLCLNRVMNITCHNNVIQFSLCSRIGLGLHHVITHDLFLCLFVSFFLSFFLLNLKSEKYENWSTCIEVVIKLKVAYTFYRATLCVSACCRPVSVCPSVMLVYCIHTVEYIVNLLSRPGSHNILVFWPQRRYPISRGTPSAGAQNTWGGIFCGFRLKSPFISETVLDRPLVTIDR